MGYKTSTPHPPIQPPTPATPATPALHRGGRGAMSIFKDLLDPQHRRRRLRHPVEYTDVEAAEALQPQKELAVLLREVSGGDGVFRVPRVEVKRWIEATNHGDFFWKKRSYPVKAYSLRT